MCRKIDPRITRTRRLLLDALTDLIVSEGIDKVNVSKIVQKAEVNRSTFYLHFYDKEDILTEMKETILRELAEIISYPTYDYKTALEGYKKK